MTHASANHLIHEQSPYLLQHAHNPVDWYPWGDEAFARATREDRPIFLSIGYATCHWCHVMARESFEDQEIGRLLNQWFVAIKVDREERPDIDQVYMAAAQALNGSGGWPLSLFLLPDGKPFWAATYIPPRSRNGQPGFVEILQAVHEAWQNRRPELVTGADRIIRAIAAADQGPVSSIDPKIARRTRDYLTDSFDPVHGGFGGAPRFPRPVLFDFLFHHFQTTGDARARDMGLTTLRHMARGGIHDQLGGGFHRYSVDSQWRVPHFEKMLYDQGQLLAAYSDGWLISGDPNLAGTARDIAAYVLRDLKSPDGAFYSAEDADSEDPYRPGRHGEGAFYLWREEEIVRTIGAAAANIFNFCYGVEFDGNAPHDPQGEFTGRNILYLARSPAEAAAHFKREEAEIRASLADSRQKLLYRRQQRRRPHLDDKILTGWNGLMISGLARAGAALDDPGLVDAAGAAAAFIRVRLFEEKTGRLLRRHRVGRSGIDGQLDDYTFLVRGLLDLYRVRQDPSLLEWAESLTRTAIDLFTDPRGGFFDVLATKRLPVRMKGAYDGAEPAANAVMAENLLNLGRILDNRDWIGLAGRTIETFAGPLNTYPPALPLMVRVWTELARTPAQVVVAGDPAAEDTRALLAVVHERYAPGLLLLLADGGGNQAFLARRLAFIRDLPVQGPARAWFCRDRTCRLPVHDPEGLAGLLEKEGYSTWR